MKRAKPVRLILLQDRYNTTKPTLGHDCALRSVIIGGVEQGYSGQAIAEFILENTREKE